MLGGSSFRGSNSSARLSWHCGVAFIAVAPKKRAEKLSFCFFDVDSRRALCHFRRHGPGYALTDGCDIKTEGRLTF